VINNRSLGEYHREIKFCGLPLHHVLVDGKSWFATSAAEPSLRVSGWYDRKYDCIWRMERRKLLERSVCAREG